MKLPRVKDWLKWVAAGFALVATASAEYDLARAIGMNEWIAIAVPGALDAYVVRALRAHREVLTAVLAMVGVNAASHLVTAGILPVDWRLITAVSAIAPLVLYRVHALSTPGEARRRTLGGVRARSLGDEHERTEDAETNDDERAYEHPGPVEHARRASDPVGSTCPVCAWWTDDPEGHAQRLCPGPAQPNLHASTCLCSVCEHARVLDSWNTDDSDTPEEWGTFEEHASTAIGVLDYVPADWSTGTLDDESVRAWAEDTSPPPLPVREPGDALDGHVPEWQRPPLTIVPPLPEGYEHDEHGVLQPGDVPFMPQARVLDSQNRSTHGGPVSLNEIKRVLAVGTPRAQRIVRVLADEHARTKEES